MTNIKRAMLAGAVALALGTTAAYADDSSNSKTQTSATTTSTTPTGTASAPSTNMTGKDKATAIGAGTGAVAGAVVGGPIGAVVGAGVGAVVGHEGTDANGKVHTANNGSSGSSWSNDDVTRAQTALNDKGYNVDVDGRFGPQTSQAVRNFQTDNGLGANGTLDHETMKALGVRS